MYVLLLIDSNEATTGSVLYPPVSAAVDHLHSVEGGAAKRTAKDLMSHPWKCERGLVEYVSVPLPAPNLVGAIGAVKFATHSTRNVGIVEHWSRDARLFTVGHVTAARWQGRVSNTHCTVV